MTAPQLGNLEAQIEALVREHISATRQAAAAAVERAFDRAMLPARVAPQCSAPTKQSRVSRRRPLVEIDALAERLYAALCAQPGETMATFAAQFGVSSKALNQPAMRLRSAGRLRSVGLRQFTRYFPLQPKGRASSG